MKLLYLAILVAAIFPSQLHGQAIDGLPPDLAWVNELVRQARSQTPANRVTQSGLNPFQNQSTNGVGIQPDKIEIDTPGGKLVVPRMNKFDSRMLNPAHSSLLYTEDPNWRSDRTGFRANPEPNHLGTPYPGIGVGIHGGSINGYLAFANATQAFRRQQFAKAKQLLEPITQMTATQKSPLMPIASLIMLANGDYQKSAEYAYAAASYRQEWDWKQIQSTYPSTQLYAEHYRQLQRFANAQPDNKDLQFLVGYHHLMLGHLDSAQETFSKLRAMMPNDQVVGRLLRRSQESLERPPAPMNFKK